MACIYLDVLCARKVILRKTDFELHGSDQLDSGPLGRPLSEKSCGQAALSVTKATRVQEIEYCGGNER
jgi:hypothetical protein